MRISPVTRRQYRHFCKTSTNKSNRDFNIIDYKIRRAVDLGKTTFTYRNGSRIVRYFHLDFLVSANNKEVMTMWEDYGRKPHLVDELVKIEYDKTHGFVAEDVEQKQIIQEVNV